MRDTYTQLISWGRSGGHAEYLVRIPLGVWTFVRFVPRSAKGIWTDISIGILEIIEARKFCGQLVRYLMGSQS